MGMLNFLFHLGAHPGECNRANPVVIGIYKKLAENGDVSATVNLDAIYQSGTGVMYLEWEGVAKNRKTALTWLKKAADQGEFQAKQLIKEINNQSK